MPDRNTHIVESDLLIIGGGSAGLWAAKRFTELLPEKPVSDEQTEQDKSPAMPAGKTIGELPANQPAAEDKHSSDDELPVVEALSEDEAVEVEDAEETQEADE